MTIISLFRYTKYRFVSKNIIMWYYEYITVHKKLHAQNTLQCASSVWWLIWQPQIKLWCELNQYACKQIPVHRERAKGFTRQLYTGCSFNHQNAGTRWSKLGDWSYFRSFKYMMTNDPVWQQFTRTLYHKTTKSIEFWNRGYFVCACFVLHD